MHTPFPKKNCISVFCIMSTEETEEMGRRNFAPK